MANDSRALQPAHKEQVKTLRATLMTDTVRGQIQMALPKGMGPDRLIRQVMTLVQTNYDLINCTQESIIACIIRAAEMHLELTGPLGHAYPVPRYNGKKKCKEAVFQIGYKGLMLLAHRTGQVCSIEPRVVGANDIFDYQYGTDSYVRHKEADDKGEATHYYCIVRYANGGRDFEVMSRTQVQKHRMKYSPPPQGRPDYSAWATAEDAMSLKTVIAKIARRCPTSVEWQNAAVEDEYREAGVPFGEDRPAAGDDQAGALLVLDRLGDPESDPFGSAEQPADARPS